MLNLNNADNKMQITHSVQQKINDYPNKVKEALLGIRTLILEVAEQQGLGDVEETLKWGEPSYVIKEGSTIRYDWKEKTPEQYYIFFNCKTKLVDTFRELYSSELTFQDNRAIVLNINEKIPKNVIRHCIELSLNYKKIKHLPLLGA